MTVKFKSQAAQGDCLITKISQLPEGIKAVQPSQDGLHIVAHSETGHHHVVDAQNAQMFVIDGNPFLIYLQVDKPTVLEHKRSFNTHEAIELDEGMYEIRRQKEYTPEGYRMVAD